MAPTSQFIPIISVIVATRNRCKALSQFIDALRMLPAQPSWELIVADNGSTDGTGALLARASDINAIVVREEKPGKSRALNTALKFARGDILLFCDDDVIPERDWLLALYEATLEYPKVNVFGGRIRVDYERVPKWIAKSRNLRTMLISEQDLGNQAIWFAEDQYPIGPNLAVRRRLLQGRSAPWPANLGPGTRIPLGDERAFLMPFSPSDSRDRLYVPDSIVLHTIRSGQLRIGRSVRRCFLGGYAAGLAGRMRDSRQHAQDSVFPLVRRRLAGSKSVRELLCILSRALGVVAGSAVPFGKIVYD